MKEFIAISSIDGREFSIALDPNNIELLEEVAPEATNVVVSISGRQFIYKIKK